MVDYARVYSRPPGGGGLMPVTSLKIGIKSKVLVHRYEPELLEILLLSVILYWAAKR